MQSTDVAARPVEVKKSPAKVTGKRSRKQAREATTAIVDKAVLSRNIRQKDIVPEQELAQWIAVIVGAGSIGHQIGRCIAAVGCLNAIIFDDDKVASENLAPQGFAPEEIGKHKANVVADEMCYMHPEMRTRSIPERFSKKIVGMLTPEVGKKIVVFSCVDSMSARTEVHKIMTGRADMLIDTRMGAETGRVIACNVDTWKDYEKTLHPDSEAFEAPCTAKATHYCALIMSGLAVSVFVKRLRSSRVPPQITVDIPFGYVNVLDNYNDLAAEATAEVTHE